MCQLSQNLNQKHKMMKYFLLLIGLLYVCRIHGQNHTLIGTIENTKSEKLSFVSISLKNTKYASVSNQDGKFKIERIPAGQYVLVVSLIGHKTIEERIVIEGISTTKNIILAEDTKELDEVVITSEKVSRVQEQKAIAIKSVDIKDVITHNTLLTDIADRIAGVRIRRSSSLGEKSDVSINGMRGNAIRIYIDGLPMEFMYPNFDVSTLPLSNIKRMDVFKGVLPVDVGTDAMGGAINIVTDQPKQSHLRASYSIGSFHTHLADFELGYALKNNFFINVNGAYNFSKNDYSMKALVYEENKVKTITRFHDAYRMYFGGINFGVHSKKWADELRFTLNYSTGYKELQNGARITTTAIGQAQYDAINYSLSVKYNKALMNERFNISTIANYSYQALDFVDTTSKVYSWSGKVVGRRSQGEYTGASNNTTNYNNFINRLVLTYQLNPAHKLLFSNLYGRQQLTGEDYLLGKEERDYLAIPQYLTKNIAGLQYDGKWLDRLTLSVAAKRFDYFLKGAENNTFEIINTQGGFWSWNAGLKYEISDELFVRGSYERGYLIPLFQQFVGNGADIVRNTDLLPESSDNINLGISATKQLDTDWRINTNINGFWREQYDIIFLGNGIVKRYENADQVNTYGVEGDISVRFKKMWTWRSNFTALRKTFSAIKDPRNAFLVGSTFPNNPTLFGNTELEWLKENLLKPNDKLRLYVFYQYVAPFNHILIGKNDNINTSPDSFVPTQQRVDLGASYRFAKQALTLAFNVNNIFNAELYDNFLVPRAGINFNLKCIFEINKL